MADSGKPDYWHPDLWKMYQEVGAADTQTAKSMRRFLASMVEQQPSAVISLGRIMAQGIKADRDPTHSYQQWYLHWIQWPEDADGQCPSVFKTETHMVSDSEFEADEYEDGFQGGWKEVDVYHPWLLRVGLQLGKRFLEGTLPPEEVDVMEDINNPQEGLTFDHHHNKLEEYLKSGEWLIDEGSLETFTQHQETYVREPKETRKEFIDRIILMANSSLAEHYKTMHTHQIMGTEASRIPTVSGRPTSEETEDMLVRRMFGERPVDIYTDVGMHSENFHRAIKRLAERLGFLPTK
jgi:hypothetical protein